MVTFWPLLFYGLGVIIGAGIYVALGTVLLRAGDAAPLSFACAGIIAALTGLCYAELSARFPEAAGTAAYLTHAFGSRGIAQIGGLALTVTVAVSAASIARGSAHYLTFLVGLPEWLLAGMVVAVLTVVAGAGVSASVGLAAVLGILEIGGLGAAIVAGLWPFPEFHFDTIVPRDASGWIGVWSGAFIAFFAFTGFETLANLAEEVKQPRRTVPLGIIAAVTVSTVLYVAVAIVTVFAHGRARSPLLDLFEGRSAVGFAMLGSLAVANGVLVQIVMLARLFYGMARLGQLPEILGRVDERTRTPVKATLLAGIIVLAATLLLPFEQLLAVANALTLLIFAAVDVALWRVQSRMPRLPGRFHLPRLVAPLAAAMALALVAMELI